MALAVIRSLWFQGNIRQFDEIFINGGTMGATGRPPHTFSCFGFISDLSINPAMFTLTLGSLILPLSNAQYRTVTIAFLGAKAPPVPAQCGSAFCKLE